tara:strand:+ start:66488 stop:67108 length:621 start_codon:yes stop_codon:yes gene_type:complete
MYEKIKTFFETVDFKTIPEERKKLLAPLVSYVREKYLSGKEVRLIFICTHNSRRSHLSQVWAQTAAAYYGIGKVSCYSGGTERTALFPMAAKALENAGHALYTLSEGDNPIYAIKYGENEAPVIGFSKKYDDPYNPVSAFGAIMTCSQADGGCPFIAGAEQRFTITYEDPKAFDGTPGQTEAYNGRSLQIATEMGYVFSQVKNGQL